MGHARRLAVLAGCCVAGLGAVAPAAGSAAATARGPSVAGALQQLWRAGEISEALYKQDGATFTGAERSLSKLRGTRQKELGAVLANVRAIAAAGELSASRLGALFLTLERNWSYWTTQPLPSNGQRLTFPPSKLVWEYYDGQGLEIQWLATFGAANGYYLAGNENANLHQLLGEVIPLATKRAGGIAWEYMFRFDGGSPPWTSGLSQGTALQVLARAWSRFKEGALLTAAQQALGIFETAPANGVRVKTTAGATYAEYSYAPNDHILNGFIQALVGLYDYTSLTKDPLGLQLFEEGDAEARAEVPHYNTGAWSMYDQFGESNLNYHELLTEFLQHLCERTSKGPPLSIVAAPVPTSPPTTNGNGGTGAVSGASGASTASVQRRAPAHSASAPAPIPGDAIYCTTAQQFSADLHTPPQIALLSTTLPTSARAGVQLSLSKISSVSLTIRKGARVVWTNRATVERGKPRVLWVTPSAAGAYSVTLVATDLAGNFASASGTIMLAKGAKPH
ncbi:MAG TPA: D-glucuronyl C5-epimerase family protein [Solirubrobacteraceae bacterium]|nr:D-glucuronyl C5-epimerase family protein [Solirubrobacteraceae bacterium]